MINVLELHVHHIDLWLWHWKNVVIYGMLPNHFTSWLLSDTTPLKQYYHFEIDIKVLPYVTILMGKALTLAYHFQVTHFLLYKNVARSLWVVFRFILSPFLSHSFHTYAVTRMPTTQLRSLKRVPTLVPKRDHLNMCIEMSGSKFSVGWGLTGTIQQLSLWRL